MATMKQWKTPPRALAGVTVAGFVLAAGCGDKQNAVQSLDVPDTAVTWCSEIEAIFAAHCTRCHASTKQGAERNGAPPNVNFDSYDAAVPNASLAFNLMQSGAMPLGGERVPADELALVSAWQEQGTPRCDATGD